MYKIDNLYYRRFFLNNGLEDFVKYIWIMKSSERKSKQDLLIADGYPEIIFVQNGAYCKEFLNSNKTPTIINRSCIIGIQTKSVLANRMNNCQLIGLKLNPLGANVLFGDRLKNIVDTNMPLDEFGSEWLSELNRNLQQSKADDSILDLISKTILFQVLNLEKPEVNKMAEAFLKSILKVDGQISVTDLAKQHCISTRHFQRKFKEFFGISPKKFLNIIRFKHLYKSSILKHKSPKDYLAYGYYDQMHFIKDFKKHLGVNPSKISDASFLQMNKIAKLSF